MLGFKVGRNNQVPIFQCPGHTEDEISASRGKTVSRERPLGTKILYYFGGLFSCGKSHFFS
jgi:hypothetical protein